MDSGNISGCFFFCQIAWVRGRRSSRLLLGPPKRDARNSEIEDVAIIDWKAATRRLDDLARDTFIYRNWVASRIPNPYLHSTVPCLIDSKSWTCWMGMEDEEMSPLYILFIRSSSYAYRLLQDSQLTAKIKFFSTKTSTVYVVLYSFGDKGQDMVTVRRPSTKCAMNDFLN